MDDSNDIKNKIEAVLYTSGYPVTYDKFAGHFNISIDEIKKIIYELSEDYRSRGINIILFDDSCQFITSEKYSETVKNILEMTKIWKLPNSALEVITIVAYHQPVTRAYIDQIRGIDSSYAINVLIERNLIESKGKLDIPGKPNIYGTTKEFLRCFGINSLEELPKLI